MPYTKQQLLAAIRADHPEVSKLSDDALFGALQQDHPDLTQGVTDGGPSPTLLASRREISKQQFEENLPAGQGRPIQDTQSWAQQTFGQTPDVVNNRRAMVRETILGGLQNLGIDPSRPLGSAAEGIGNLFKIGLTGNAQGALNLVKGAAEAAVKGPIGLTQATNPVEFGTALGQTTTGTAPVLNTIGEGIRGAVESIPAETLRQTAADHTLRALAPRTREMKAMASNIAPELAARKIPGSLTGKAYDNAILDAAEADGNKVGAAEDQLRNSNITLRGFGSRVAAKIQGVIDSLKVQGEGGDVVEDPAALENLQRLQENALKIGDNPSINTVIKWRRALDQATMEKGGFKAASSIADKTKIMTQRQTANLVRQELSEASPDVLAPANHDFHISRSAADIVEDRQLGKVGSISPSTGDALLTLGGYATEGIPGAIGVPLAKAALRSRGLSAGIASKAQGLYEGAIERNFQNLKDVGRLLPPPNKFDLGSGPDTSGPQSTADFANHNVREFTPKRLPASGESLASTGLNTPTGPTNAGTQLWMRAGARGLPPSPTLDKLTAGVAYDKVPKEEFYKFDNIAKDAAAVKQQMGFDPIDAIDHMTGSPALRAQILTRPEGRTVVGGLINAMKRQSGRDVGFYTNKLQSLIDREIKRGPQ